MNKSDPGADEHISPAELAKLKMYTSPSARDLMRWALYLESPQSAQSFLLLAASEAIKLRVKCERLQLEIGRHEDLQQCRQLTAAVTTNEQLARIKAIREVVNCFPYEITGLAIRDSVKFLLKMLDESHSDPHQS